MSSEDRLWTVAWVSIAAIAITLLLCITTYEMQSNRVFAENGYISCPGTSQGWCKK